MEKKQIRPSGTEMNKIKANLQSEGIFWIPFSYSSFGPILIVKFLFLISRLWIIVVREKIGVVHSWCTPAGALGYLLASITRTKLTLDSFEPHAESMVENGTWLNNGLKFRILSWFENKQVRKADYVIGTTQGIIDYVKRSFNYELNPEIFYVKPACVDLKTFQLVSEKDKQIKREQMKLRGKVIAVYAGKLGGIYHDTETFRMIKSAADYWKGDFSFLMLTNISRDKIEEYAKTVGLDPDIVISKFVPHDEVWNYLSIGDFGLTPVKSVPTKRYCTPIKDGEYWALGLPVLITKNISDDSAIIYENNIGAVIEDLSDKAYLNAFQKIDELLKGDHEKLKMRIREIAERNRSFKIAEDCYKNIYANEG